MTSPLLNQAEEILNAKGYVRNPFESTSDTFATHLVMIKPEAEPVLLNAYGLIKILRLAGKGRSARMRLDAPCLDETFKEVLESL